MIAGNLQVDGTTTTINSTTMTVDDKNITLASGSANAAAASGAGFTVDIGSGTLPAITYDGTNDEWDFNKPLNVTGNIAVSGTVDGVDIAARDAVLTSTTTTAGAALPKAGGTMTGGLSIRGFNGPVLKLGSSGTSDPRIDFEDQNSTNLGAGIFLDQDADTLRILRTVSGSATDGIAINASGNVGIGTVSPGAKLDVNGAVFISPDTVGKDTIRLTTNAGNDGRILIKSDTTTTVDIQANGVSYLNGGNVGIGDVSPDTKLHVLGNVKVGSAASSAWAASIQDAGGLDVVVGSGSTGFRVWDDNSQSTPRFIVTRAGNVGIGTASPSYKLALKDNSASAYPLSLESNTIGTPGNHTGIRFGYEGNTYQKGAIIFEGQDANGRGKMYFAMEGSANSSNADETDAKMTIDYSGNVGIGTTAPFSKLEVTGMTADAYTATAFNDKPAITIKHANTSTNYGGIRFCNTVGNYEHFFGSVQTGTRADMVFQGYNAGSAAYQEHMRIEDTGNVGIGTASPQKKFHVEHTAGASEGILISGASDTVGHTAGILLRAEGGEADSSLRAKAGIFLERTATYGIGKLHIANRHNSDNVSATISDANITIYDDKVGIGTNAPTAPMQLNTAGNTADGTYYSTFTINNTGSSTWSRLRFDRSGVAKWGITLGSDDKFRISNLFTAGSVSNPNDEVLVIDNNSNIGIGVSSPTRSLVLGKGDSTGVQTQYTNSTTGAALGDGFTVGIDGSENAEFWNFENTNMLFATNGTERMLLNSDGHLLVGVTSRSADVGGSTTGIRLSATGQLMASSSGTGAYNYPAYFDRRGTNNTGDSITLGLQGYLKSSIGVIGTSAGTDDGGITFNTWASNATRTTKMTIFSTVVASEVDVSIKNGKNLELQTTSGVARGYISAQETNTNGTHTAGLVISTSNGESITFKDNGTAGTTNMVIDGAGRVGLPQTNQQLIVGAASDTTHLYGTTSVPAIGIFGEGAYASGGAHIEIAADADIGWSPIYINKFDWQSGDDARWLSFGVNGYGTDSGTISYDGTNFAILNGSDYRLKENIIDYSGGLAKIEELQVRSYNKKEGVSKDITQQGFIAHEAALANIPGLVLGAKDAMKEDEMGNTVPDYQTINREALIPYLVSAIQELTARVRELENS